MKKYILISGLAIFATAQAYAQGVGLGPEIGVNMSTMMAKYNGVKTSGGYLPGLKLGGVLDIGLTPLLSMQTGLTYQMQGYKNDVTSTVVLNNVTYEQTQSSTVRIHYLQVPLNLQFNFATGPGDFFVGFGPYAAFAMGGNVKATTTRTVATSTEGAMTTTETTHDLKIGDNRATDDIVGTDIGLNLNTGYKWNSGLFLRGNAGFGLSNLQPGGDTNNSLRNFSLALSVGYLFGM